MKPSNSRAVEDLGPLAWVLDEVKKSVSSATKSLRRYVRDAEAARGSDLASVDANALRVARQQIHQACGALEMVGQAGPNLLLKAMEEVVQHAVQKPELCTDATVDLIERCGFALTEYLERAANGKTVEPVELFSHYRDARSRVGAHRIHPADLWAHPWRWADPAVSPLPSPTPLDVAFRVRMDQLVLRFVRTGDVSASRDLVLQCLTIAVGTQDRQSIAFWKIAAGFFEAIAEGLLLADVYVKRIASRILLQAAMTARGDSAVADQLGRDLLFFCANAVVPANRPATALRAVRRAFGLESHAAIQYDSSPYGKFDPTLLTQAAKRIASAKELWTAVVSGETDRGRAAVDQFSMVSDSLLRLSPITEALATALQTAAQVGTAGGHTPSPELAMEVATAVLFVESVLTDFRPETPEFAQRTLRIAQRLNAVAGGGMPEPLDAWIEELYRQVSDQQTIGSVVGELKAALGELESALDQFFRNPNDKTSLKLAPVLLTQIRGVLSVLGLNAAVKAIQALREQVDNYLVTDVNAEHGRASGNFDRIGNTLGVLSFLLDMLNYQPALVKKLFAYDEDTGELQYVMRRGGAAPDSQLELSDDEVFGSAASFEVLPPDGDVSNPSMAPHREAIASVPIVGLVGAGAAVMPSSLTSFAPQEQSDATDGGDQEILDIFLEEAAEVVVNGRAAVMALERSHTDWPQLTTLRRAFHTLKGSSRMVGLDQFGEAGWSMEQLLNAWLSDNRPAHSDLLDLCMQAFDAFEAWVGDIQSQRTSQWSPEPFRRAADALRLDGLRVALVPDVSGVLDSSPLNEPAPLLDGEALVSLSSEIQADVEPLSGVAIPAIIPEVTPQEAPLELELELDRVSTPESGVSLQDSGDVVAPLGAIDLSIAGDTPDATLTPELEPELDLTLAELDALFEFEPSVRPVALAGADAKPTALELVAEDAGLHEVTVDAAGAAGFLPVVELDLDFASSEDHQLVEAALPDAGRIEDVQDVFSFVGETEQTAPVDQDTMPASHLMLVGGSDLTPDDQTKVIGELRLPIPLYNVFLNEADEWSRQLQVLMSELVLAPEMGVPADSVVYAHSLAGSSATVGFHALSGLAREMEHALMHLGLVRSIPEVATQSLQHAADEIRRLLHQFAAGFLKTVDTGLMDDLRAIQSVEASDSTWPDDDFVVCEDPVLLVTPPEPEPVVSEDVTPVDWVQPSAPAFALPLRVSSSRELDVDFDEGDDPDDALDVTDAVDPDLFPIFEEEAIDLLPRLGSSLRQWVHQPDNDDWRVEALRVLHTLKGSARLAGAMRMGEAAHRLESLIEHLPREQLQSAEIEPLLARSDALDAMLRKLTDEPRSASAVLQEALDDMSVTDAVPVLSGALAEPGVLPVQGEAGAMDAVAQPAPLVLSTIRSASQQMVRVRSGLLDRLVGQAGEVMITRSRLDGNLIQMRVALGELTANLEKLRRQLRDVELQAEVQMQSRLAQSRDIDQGFDPLEFDRFTRVQELTRMMAESVNDVATVQRTLERSIDASEGDLAGQMRQTRELQRDLLRTRMVEFESISERLYRVVRLAAKDSGKQVRLDITGGSIEMDRGVLERMAPAFEHLLRNGVGHGIEAPGVREAAGKSPVGTIAIDLRQEGNEVLVEFRDDGAGLNLERIQRRAVERGLMQADVDMPSAELAQMIFEPGFSTAEQVTELSGRGIGMDVVRSEVTSLGGRIEIASQTAEGSRFGLHLPLTTAVTQIVLVRAGNLSVGAPATVVELVLRYSAAQLEQAYRDGSVNYGGETIPFHWAGALLQASEQSQEPAGKTSAVVVFRSASQRVAVHVDDVLGNQEVVIKKLGAQLVRLPGLSGMTALASGAVVLIYNPVALAAVYGERARRLVSHALAHRDAMAQAASQASSDVAGQGDASMASTHDVYSASGQALSTHSQDGRLAPATMQPAAGLAPLVLVVDDSVTVRRVSQRLLLREGYRVTLASDGLQAIEKLAEERPALVLSDIEMPRMDGFDLVRNIRQDASLAGMPVIMITSRIAEKHREHARELGVNHYLGKPFVEDDLMRLVRQYAQPSAVDVIHA